MSIQPPRGPAGGQPSGEAPPPSRKRKRGEEVAEEVAKKSLPGEEQAPEKKRKREVEQLEPREEDVEMALSEEEEEAPSSRKRKAEEAPEARKKQKTGLSPREALIHDLAQKKESTDPETIINCLDALHDNKLLKDGDAAAISIVQSLINNIREEAFTENQSTRINTLLKYLFSDIQDTELKNRVGDIVSSFTTSLRFPNIQDNLAFIKQTFPERLESILVAIFQTPDVKKVSLEQKIQIFSFIHEHGVQLKEPTWCASRTLLNPSMSDAFILGSTILDIPENERAATIRDSLPLFDQMDGFDISQCLKKVGNLPQEDRISIVTNTVRLSTEGMSSYGKFCIMDVVLRVPQQDREALIQNCISLLRGRTKWDETVLILEAMQKVPQHERQVLIQDISSLLKDNMSGHEIAALLGAMHKVPQQERAPLIQDTLSLFSSTMDGHGKAALLKTINKISRSDRKTLIEDTMPLLHDDMHGREKAQLLETLYEVPQHERAPFIQETRPLHSQAMDTAEWIRLLKALVQVPQAELRTLIQDTSPLLHSNMQSDGIFSLLKTIRKIPRAERATLIQDCLPLFVEDTTGSGKSLALETVQKILPEERRVLIHDILPLFDDRMDVGDKLNILAAIQKVPRAERAAFVQECSLLFAATKNRILFASTKVGIIEDLLLIPKEKRSELIQEITPVLPRLLHVASPVITFYLLPASLRTQDKLPSTGNILKDPEYQAAITSSLERELSDEKTPLDLLQKLADFVTTQLSLHDEHPLLQQAIEILSAAAVAGEKNPFSLHKKLQALVKVPTEFKPSEYEVAGTMTTFRLDILQASAKAFEVAREELPQDATEEAWNQLIQGLKQKVETDDSAKRQLEEYAATWTELWEGCLSDSYLSGLLKLSGERVSIVEAQFRAVIHHLLTQEKSVQPGKIFSEQEELLIKQAMSIQHCSGGKKEGIALTYKLLDPAFKYRAKGLEGGDPEEIRAREFLADVLQKALSDQFSGTNALMQELTGIQQIEQAPHQAIYLKNLLGPLVGLRHDVAFDKHTGVLYDALIAKPREEVLQAFFRHFTPQDLVKELMRVVNNDFRTNSKIIRDIVGDKEECWDWDEDTFAPIRLNERGALQILQKVGYLT